MCLAAASAMRSVLCVLLLVASSALAQDVLTVGSGVAPSGGTVSIPISIRDVSGTPIGADQDVSLGIRAFAFKIFYPDAQVASISFARAGITASITPMYERTLQGPGWISYLATFNQTLAFTSNATAPGNQIGTLTVTLEGSLPNGTVAALTFDPMSVALSNQASTHVETIANGNASIVNGSVTVSGALAAPTNLVATASGTTSVALTWSAVGGADHYEVWRSFNGGAYALIGSPSAAAFTDSAVSANTTYLYQVLAVNAVGGESAFSNVDAATTIVFQDDPLSAGMVIEAAHIIELRTAINAFRASASLAPLSADATIGAGQVVRASHMNALRNGITNARLAVGMPLLAFTDTVTAGVTTIKAVHVQELRDGVR